VPTRAEDLKRASCNILKNNSKLLDKQTGDLPGCTGHGSAEVSPYTVYLLQPIWGTRTGLGSCILINWGELQETNLDSAGLNSNSCLDSVR